MNKLKKGFVQIYTGNGKGKSTAAIGQAVRAAGFGLKSYIAQFMKEYPYSELVSLKHLSELISVEQFGGDEFVYKKELPSEEELTKAKRGLQTARDKMLSGDYDIIILDEVIVAIYFKLFETKDIVEFIKSKPENVELILTGRYCPEELIDLADLVTEMQEIKHYYQKGITSRRGIES
ncbi:MAG: cob(I)yrinic acid a,c-diamide adenosyltransferase [Ignavibacteriota bacterium]|nr:MAG: cob(I)yrinic acid a,c-diamide adenosyltransferase [Chlorobiota bacterium]MBE7475534.1 cob(I)yrinic acid a,c-diamide adenosyltransferase [Ignavibacteriales bacterium]MBL1122494.1 cob(I)yrinic acid a,c-diamide adenosyltransferase [Ignavibacteriota bacterium]MCE7856561.1 cob(I)yrinic acid a,c-diamide adenosyltransferase [Ignavibacteria bacterium CHB3]MCL4278273.1 cob(I)yrinic acid a,c-diamide adenosyltransferase [Ignavibacteriaceae bacterium]MEB2296196.1 cob(I)yrinic acid a,c-diamide aden